MNESDSTERFVADSEAQVTKRSTNSDTFAKSGNHNSNKISSIASSHGPAKGRSKSDVNHARAAAFAAQDKDLNHVDHLSPVATMAMLANPELSYVDRVILELLETEQMYVKSLRDILTVCVCFILFSLLWLGLIILVRYTKLRGSYCLFMYLSLNR